MSLVCAYCKKPLELIKSVESEVSGAVHEETEYMCSNPRCPHGSRIINKSSRPLHKQGYIVLSMLHKKNPPKSWFQKLFREKTKQGATGILQS